MCQIAERGQGRDEGEGEGLSQMSDPLKEKLNKCLISTRLAAPERWPLSQAF